MSDPRKYTIGWISVTSIEGLAAELFLDERHEPPKRLPRDSNNYTVGRIGSHNVVIATLPNAEYGTDSAATVVSNMVRTFTNVRVGLMVGIGGGAPTANHDVRLGDVVVGAPGNGVGGVIQYDYGKSMPDGTFMRTRHLDQPPAVLRAAVGSLKRLHDIHGVHLQADIDRALQMSRKHAKYVRPPPATDKLYKSDFAHARQPSANCDACGDNPASLVLRRERHREEDDDPAVHYGLIASSDTLLRNARLRDHLARSEGVLCFETEAAGLANRLPCLAIRGICDYSDSHKNKNWQGYASMAAAAYAKNLILHIGSDRASVPVTRVGRH